MRKYLVNVFLLFILAFLTDASRTYFSPSIEKEMVQEEIHLACTDTHPHFSICNNEKSFANICSQQSPTFASNLMRRYRPAGFVFERLYTYLEEEKNNSLSNIYKKVFYQSEEYSALLKDAGYYIYTLREIIV